MFDISKFADYPTWVKLAALAWVFLTLFLSATLIFLKPEKEVAPVEGTTKSNKKSDLLKFPDHKFIELPEEITITFATNSATYKIDKLKKNKVTPFSIFDTKIYAFIENNVLYADAEIYGGKNKGPITIKKNTLSLLPSGWDFNSTSRALEIVNENNVPIYQLIYKTPNHIEINGIFVTKGGLVLANEDGIQLNPPLPILHKLKRIFKYPSYQYQGEYIE